VRERCGPVGQQAGYLRLGLGEIEGIDRDIERLTKIHS
jgi:hypothetical protein